MIFFVHAFIAAYCLMCGLLDAYGQFRPLLIPNSSVLYLLLTSAIILPIVAALSVVGSGHQHPVVLIVTHIAMSAGQLLLGLMPLVS